MKQSSGHTRLALATMLLLGWSPSLSAQVVDPNPHRFAEDFGEFAQWDAKNSVPANAILFVGSSSIVRWNTAEAFPGLPVINRGFGGSQASDATHWVEDAVLRYNPATVVHYEGDNDIGRGKQAQQVVDDIKEFSEAVLAADPSTQIVLLSIKPSLRRWSDWPEMQVANALLRDYAATRPNLHYVDVGTPMLGADGRPMPNLFVSDGLHMTSAGYEIWNEIVGRTLTELHHH